MKKKLLIIGASGHGKVVADVALKMKKWKEIVFLDDNEELKKSIGFKIIGKSQDVHLYLDEYAIFIGIGNNSIRQRLYEKVNEMGAFIPVLVHPTAVIGSKVTLGKGTIVMAGSIINCCTDIGEACIINTSSIIEHDNSISNFVHISPGVNLAGTVTIGERSWLGIGSTVLNNINIISDCIVGAGSVVHNNLVRKGTYVGIPVKKLE